MKLSKVTYSKYNYPFITPLQTSKSILTNRQGIILKFETENGLISFGEAAPLPRYGSEDIDQLEQCLKKYLDSIEMMTLPGRVEDIDLLLSEFNLTPTLRFAFEQAFFELLIKSDSATLDFNSRSVIPVNALLSFKKSEETLFEVSEFIRKGFHTIKFKAGIKEFNTELKILKKIRKNFPDIKLRLDVNCKWDKKTTLNNLSQLENLNIEYIEQPVNDIDDLIYVAGNSVVPIAADESVRTIEEAIKIIDSNCIKYIVLKPMLLGGFFITNKICELAKEKCNIIISSSLETNIGRRFLVFITAQNSGKYAHGLSTSDLYKDDPVRDFFPVENGFVNFSLNKYSQLLRTTES